MFTFQVDPHHRRHRLVRAGVRPRCSERYPRSGSSSIRATSSSSSRWRRSSREYPCLRYFIGDVRDKDRLRRALEGIDIVVHAAALKQVPAAEYNPFECIKTNVLGAQNVIEACLDSERQARRRALDRQGGGADQPLRRDQALLRQAVHRGQQHHAASATSTSASCATATSWAAAARSFRSSSAARASGVLPITDPEMTRFNITLEEGVEMVLWAHGRMRGRRDLRAEDPSLPDHRCRRGDRARMPSIEIVGIRPGEKLHEEMITAQRQLQHASTSAAITRSCRSAGDVLRRRLSGASAAARRSPPGFAYNSGTNDRVPDASTQLRELIARHVDRRSSRSRS